MITLRKPAKPPATYAEILVLADKTGEAEAIAFFAENPKPWRHQHGERQRNALNRFLEPFVLNNEKTARVSTVFRNCYRATFKRLQKELAASQL